MKQIGELKMTLRMQPGQLLRIYVTSVSKDPDMLMPNSYAYQKRYTEQLRAAGPFNSFQIYIDSHGGAVDSALGMLSTFTKELERIPGAFLIDGECGSAATLVAFGHAAKVFITPRSRVFVHAPKQLDCCKRGGIWTIFEKLGKSSTTHFMIATYRSRTKQPRRVIRQWIAEGVRFTPKEAVSLGFCQQVMSLTEFQAMKGFPS